MDTLLTKSPPSSLPIWSFPVHLPLFSNIFYVKPAEEHCLEFKHPIEEESGILLCPPSTAKEVFLQRNASNNVVY